MNRHPLSNLGQYMKHLLHISTNIGVSFCCRTSLTRFLPPVLLLIQAYMALDLIPRYSVTRDECAHIPAGLACWHEGRFELYRVNPPLSRMVATAPLLLHNDISISAIQRIRADPNERHEFEVAYLFAATNSLNYHDIVCRARVMGVVWLLAGGSLLWRWAVQLYGPQAGMLAVGMWVTEPMLNAHGCLVTPDLPAAVAGLCCGYFLWCFVRFGTTEATLSAGTALGFALLIKFTHLLWIPIIILLALATIFFTKSQTRTGYKYITHSLAWQWILIAIIAWAIVWAGYCFRGFGRSLGDLTLISKVFEADTQHRPLAGTWLSSMPCPLPPDFIQGIDTQQRDFEGGMQSYMRGKTQASGWWYFYIYALAVKLPVGFLVLIGLAIAAILIRRPDGMRNDLFFVWLPPVMIISVASLKSGYTEHARYILPAFPFIILAVSRLAKPVQCRSARLLPIIIWSMLAWQTICSMYAYPHWLGYFNEFAGGSSIGWWHLDDSNVDWGHDLIALARWTDEHPDMRPLRIGCHHYINPMIYLHQVFDTPSMEPGYVAVDAYTLVHNERWLLEHRLVGRIGTSFFIFRIS